jgi:hypothetical protein
MHTADAKARQYSRGDACSSTCRVPEVPACQSFAHLLCAPIQDLLLYAAPWLLFSAAAGLVPTAAAAATATAAAVV